MASRPGTLPAALSQVGRSYAGVGTQVAPAAGTVIAQTDQLPAGRYFVRVFAGYGATPDAINNMQLNVGNRRSMGLYVLDLANNLPPEQVFDVVEVFTGETLSVSNIAGGAAGSVYLARVVATPIGS